MDAALQSPGGCPRALGLPALLVLLALGAGPRGQAGLLTFGDYLYSVEGDQVTIRRYLGSGGEAVIPDTIEDRPVTTIHRVAFNRSEVASVILGQNVASIGEEAFSECMSLTNVVLSDSVTSLGPSVFEHCRNLTDVTIGSGLSTLADSMFDDCRSLRHITVPDTVSAIGNFVFSGCVSLAEVTIPDSVQSIGAGAFGGCASLTEVVLPAGVPLVDRFLVADCSRLARVVIPGSVTRIGTLAFRNCSSLLRLEIPAGVTDIESYAFTGCTALSGVYCHGDAPDTGRTPFTGVVNVVVYHLPGTSGWEASLGGVPTRLWLPEVSMEDGGPGVGQDGFGFLVWWAGGRVVVVEASSDPGSSEWEYVRSHTLVGGVARFSDPTWEQHARRFYRLRWP